MTTLLLLFALKIATAGELACVGSIQDTKVHEDIYIAGVSGEGIAATGAPGQIIYLNGPGVSFLKPGTVQRVVRPEGRVRDPQLGSRIGTYYKDIGTVKVEVVGKDNAIARVIAVCEGMLKGDLLVSGEARPAVEFNGNLSTAATPVRGGLTSSILFGRNDARQLVAGDFCFIQLGKRDGIQPGDHFLVFRSNPAFNSRDLAVGGSGADTTYGPIRHVVSRDPMKAKLKDRNLPPKVLGDLIIVEVGEKTATAKIVNSLWEINPGDYVVKK